MPSPYTDPSISNDEAPLGHIENFSLEEVPSHCSHDSAVFLEDIFGNEPSRLGHKVKWCPRCEATWWETEEE